MGWGIAQVAIMINTVAVCGCPFLSAFPTLYKTVMSQMHIAPTASPIDRFAAREPCICKRDTNDFGTG
jgi:hypothetical protein